MKRIVIPIACLCVLLVACADNEPERKDLEEVYFDYRIWGEEGREEVTCVLQFRQSRRSETTYNVDSAGRVEFDGVVLTADSAARAGNYYEIRKPLSEFIGQHIISYITPSGQNYTDTINFQPLTLITEIPETMSRGDWVLELGGVSNPDYVRVIAIDTLFESDDINAIDTVRNGRLVIERSQLENLVNGPITLEIFQEKDLPVRDATRKGGRISINYGLKRHFVLTD